MAYRLFNNLVVGDPTNVLINKNTAGYAENGSVKSNITKVQFKPGTPGRLVKSTINKFGFTFETNLLESRVENFLLAMGLDDNILSITEAAADVTYYKSYVTRANNHAYNLHDYLEPASLNGYLYEVTTAGTTDGSPPTYPTTVGQTVTDGGAVLTCRAYPSETVTREDYMAGSNHCYELTGYNLKVATPPKVYKSDYSEMYTEGTDYHVDYKNGRIIDTGSLGATLKVVYSYVPITDIKILLSPDDFVVLQNQIDFQHVKATTGEMIEITFFNMQSNKFTFPMNSEKSDLKVSFDAMADDNRVGYEYGRIMFYLN